MPVTRVITYQFQYNQWQDTQILQNIMWFNEFLNNAINQLFSFCNITKALT